MAERIYVSDEELAALTMERATGLHTQAGTESPVDQAQRMLRENSPMAAASLIRLARFSESDTIRLRASTEILNRAMAQGSASDGRDPWDNVYDNVLTTKDVDDMVKHANNWRARNGE